MCPTAIAATLLCLLRPLMCVMPPVRAGRAHAGGLRHWGQVRGDLADALADAPWYGLKQAGSYGCACTVSMRSDRHRCCHRGTGPPARG